MDTSKEVGRCKKSDDTDWIIRVGEFKENTYIDVREYQKSENYMGFTKRGIMMRPEQVSEIITILTKALIEVDE